MSWKLLWILFGGLFLLYALAMIVFFGDTSFFSILLVISITCFIFAYFSSIHLYSKLPSLLQKCIVVIAICAIGILFVESRIASGFAYDCDKDLDYIIVLGAQIHEDGPSVVLKYRLDTAKSYLDEHPNAKCILSGGKGFNEPYSEAKGMQKYLVENGIDESRCILEDTSRDTFENLENSKEFLDSDNHSVGIISNNFHMFRAVSIAKTVGYKNVYGIASSSRLLYLPNNMFREFFGIIKDFLRGYITF